MSSSLAPASNNVCPLPHPRRCPIRKLTLPAPAVKQVHKDLDLVGWYSLVPKPGPNHLHVPIHEKILCRNDSAVLLGFHPEDVINPAAGDPLPITIYESNMEATESAEGEDAEMKDNSAPAAPRQQLKFRELPYTVDSGEAEMIAMQFIREGAATASLESAEKHIVEQFQSKVAVDDGKGKRRAVDAPAPLPFHLTSEPAATTTNDDPNAELTKAESEYMSSLQAKYNAIKMMKSRVDLVIAYLEGLPTAATQPSNKILRLIQALVTNVELASPAQNADLEREMQQVTNDVNLVKLIANLVTSVNDVREAGKKFAVVESMKPTKGRINPDLGAGIDSFGGTSSSSMMSL